MLVKDYYQKFHLSLLLNLAVNAIKDIFKLGDVEITIGFRVQEYHFKSNYKKIFDFFKSVVNICNGCDNGCDTGRKNSLQTLGILDKSPQDIRDEIANFSKDRIKIKKLQQLTSESIFWI